MGRVRNSEGSRAGHRAGPLKQANKKHKTGRHRSKGMLDTETRGKSLIKTLIPVHNQCLTLSLLRSCPNGRFHHQTTEGDEQTSREEEAGGY